jgi:hypothetical protein
VGSIVSSIVGSIVGSIVHFIVDSVIVGSLVGSMISTLELSLFHFFPFSVVDTSAVSGTMLNMPLISHAARLCKNKNTCIHPNMYPYVMNWNTVGNMDASDSRCICIGNIITTDLRLVVSRVYSEAVTRRRLRAAVTLSLPLGADLLGCINCTRENTLNNDAAYIVVQTPKSHYRSVQVRVTLWQIWRMGKLHVPLTVIWR